MPQVPEGTAEPVKKAPVELLHRGVFFCAASPEKDLRGLDYLLLYFTRESAADCARVTEDFRLRRKSEEKRTGGLYYRELL